MGFIVIRVCGEPFEKKGNSDLKKGEWVNKGSSNAL
jgi:hypothetical protein